MKKIIPIQLLVLILFMGCLTDKQPDPEREEPDMTAAVDNGGTPEKPADAAIEEKTESDESVEEPVESWRVRLTELQVTGDMEGILSLLNEHVRELDESESVLRLSLFVTAGRLEEAEAWGGELLNRHPENVSVLYLNALVMDMEGRSDEADELIDKAYDLSPEDPDVNLFLAEMSLRTKSYTRASKYLNVVLEQEPDNFSALVAKADVLMHMGEGNDELNEKFLKDAVKVLDKVEAIAPDYVYTYVDRSRALAVLGDTRRAMNDLNKAIELEPNVEWHYLDRIVLNLRYFGHLDKALEDIKSLEAINDNNLFAHIYAAGVYDDLKEYDKALEYYEKVMTAREDYAYSYEGAGKIYYMKEEYAKAEKCFLMAYDLIFPYEGFLLMAALSMKHQGDNFKAKEILNEGIKTLDRESLMYEIFRYVRDGGSDFFIAGEIPREEDEDLRNKGYYYLGEMYLLQDSPLSAQASFRSLSEEDGYFEADIANWHNRGVDE